MEQPTPEQIEQWRIKAEKWDKLDADIGKFYEDEDAEGDLCDIGETVAIHLGYL